MLKPTFRFLALPLGAVCLLVLLSSQNAVSRPARDAGIGAVRQQVTDCSKTSPADVCIVSFDTETAR